jgi:hypothetical protein
MKTITIDVIKGTADVHAVEGDVGVKVTITNTPQEWKNCTVYALLTQGSESQHIKVVDDTFKIPSEFTDANKAFKFGVYAVGADGSRDVRPSIWIRVENSDFTTDDIEITQQTIDEILMLQAQYTKYENAEKDRVKAETKREEAEAERVEAESRRETDIITMKQDISDLQDEMEKKVDAEFGMGLSTNDFTDSDAMKLSDIEDGAQKNVQSDWNTSDTKSDAYIKNKPVIDQSYKSESQNAQSGTAVAQAIAQLVGSAPDKLNTLEELADALKDNADIVDVLNEAIGGKVDKADGYGLSQIDYGTNISGQPFVVLNTVNVDNEPVQIFLYPIAETNALLALKADKSNHSDGFEGGSDASAESGGGAVGEHAQSYGGGSIGNYTFAMGGGAIGYKAETGDGFAGGYYARTVTNDEGIAIDAIQLGTGQNTQPGTLQIYNYTLMNADGRIPAERMAVTPITEIPATLSPNTSYNFGDVESLHTAFPAIANDGDVIYLTFMVGGANPNITIDFTNASDIDIETEANTGYEIYAKYNGSIWIVGYSEYTVTEGKSV